MSKEKSNQSDQKNQPPREPLPTVILKFLVFLAFAFVLFEATVGLGDQDLSTSRTWVIVAGMAGLLLLLAVDRLTGLKVSATGLEATLAEAQAHALEEINRLEDTELAEAARAQVLQAESPSQVEAAMAVAVELNANRIIERVTEAIRAKRRCYVSYKPDPEGPVETYQVAPLDIKPGKTPATRANDYLWVYSYEHESILSLRLGRVMGIEISEEIFDPKDVTAGWKKEPEWNVTREW